MLDSQAHTHTQTIARNYVHACGDLAHAYTRTQTERGVGPYSVLDILDILEAIRMELMAELGEELEQLVHFSLEQLTRLSNHQVQKLCPAVKYTPVETQRQERLYSACDQTKGRVPGFSYLSRVHKKSLSTTDNAAERMYLVRLGKANNLTSRDERRETREREHDTSKKGC